MSSDPIGRSRKRELFGRGSIYTLASAVQVGSTVLILPFVTRLLTSSEFGVVATATVLAQLLGLIATFGINGSVMLEFFADRTEPGPSRRLVGVSIIAAVLFAGVADLTGPVWSQVFGDLAYGPALHLAVWSGVPLAVLASVQALLRSMGRPWPYVIATASATAGGHALGAILVLVTDGGSTVYLAGVLIGALAGTAFGLVAGGVAWPTRRDRTLVARALRVGLPLVPHVMAMFALLAVDRIVIESVLGLEAAGRYQVASLVGAGGLSLLAAVNNAWSPMVLGAAPDDRWSVLAGTTRDLEKLLPGLVAVIALGAPLLLRIAAPASYDPAELATITTIVSVSVLPYLWYLSGVHVVFFQRRTGVLAWTTPAVAVLAVTANLLLLPTFGLPGAAAVTVASYGLLAWRVRRAAARLVTVGWDRASSILTAGQVAAVAVAALVLPADGPWLIGRLGLALGVAGIGARTLLEPWWRRAGDPPISELEGSSVLSGG